jgi:hypothetical protein
VRLTPAARAAALLALAACASVGDPPGGPPDTAPPVVQRVAPDSGAVVQPPHEADIYFDEVVSERVAAPRPDISSAVLLSPVRGEVEVGWHRDRISVRPKEGFKAGRVYRLELFPVLADLRQNRMKRGQVWLFSTGPEFPTATLAGSVVDWPGGRIGTNALVEAVLLPDSLPYRTLADSQGAFQLQQMPAGEYLVYGVIDQDNNRQRGPREAFDTVRVHLADTAAVELFAFTHDTTGPRLRSVEAADSFTLRLTFDRPLDPAQHLDTADVRFALQTDSTTPLALVGVWTQLEADSVRTAQSARRAAADSARMRLRADSARARPPSDSVRAGPPAPAPGQAPPQAVRSPRAGARPAVRPPPLAVPGAAAPGRPGGPAAPRDSSRAMKMLARHPPPTAVRLVRLESPLAPGSRYIVWVSGARGLSGPSGDARGQISVPVERAPVRGARNPNAADSLRARADTSAPRPLAPDTTRPGAPVPRDSTRPPPPPALRAARERTR